MKKFCNALMILVIMMIVTTVSAAAMVNNTLKVGLRYGSSALFSANLENAVGSGYAFGYFDSDRSFVPLGETEETAISMTAAGNIYLSSSGVYTASGSGTLLGKWHAQLEETFDSFEDARDAASAYSGGYPAWINGEFRVRIGCFSSREAAEALGEAVSSSSTGVLVTVTRTDTVLFEFDCQGAMNLGVQPQGRDTLTWFKGYKYRGAFEYPRITGGNVGVLNVVDVEDYVKGVVPYEMSGSWPLSALEAQAVCARTYASRTTKHLKAYGFDVCATTDCQVYNGANAATANSDRAVENTEGICMYYDGALIDAVYASSNGGASEDAENVWGGSVPYLLGKQDPYEDAASIPNYNYSITYTAAQLTWILQQKGYSIGTVADAYVSEFTPNGNVYKVTFRDTAGKTVTVKGDTCRSVFYSSTYGKSVRSMRFTISGGSGGSSPAVSGKLYVNGTGSTLSSLDGVSVLSGKGVTSVLSGENAYARTSSGTSQITAASGGTSGSAESGTGFTVSGTGSGHNVGMSQYGAKAMAEQGYGYEDILNFYYTDITLG